MANEAVTPGVTDDLAALGGGKTPGRVIIFLVPVEGEALAVVIQLKVGQYVADEGAALARVDDDVRRALVGLN